MSHDCDGVVHVVQNLHYVVCRVVSEVIIMTVACHDVILFMMIE